MIVIQPILGWLHCGMSVLIPRHHLPPVTQQFPSLLCSIAGMFGGFGLHRLSSPTSIHPADPRLAPLRHGVGGLHDCAAATVTQPILGWLHCGTMNAGGSDDMFQVIQPILGWLHCGRISFASASGTIVIIRPIPGWLYCDTYWPRGDLAVRHWQRLALGRPPVSGRLHCGLVARVSATSLMTVI